ncbi:MAG: HlyD family efflux transporter periplasmic adaptor subunit [Pirellulaceae bacterium]
MPATSPTKPEPSQQRSKVWLRRDLTFAKQAGGQHERWVVKDPVTLRYFHFGPHEVFIMRQLDGRRSLEEIQTNYDQVHSPARISQREINQFCHQLHAKGLLVGSSAGQGDVLLKRRGVNRWMRWTTTPLGIFAIKFPGVDPERFLAATVGYVGWLFSKAMVTLVLLAATVVLLLGLIQSEAILARMPSMEEFFRGENVVLMLVSLAVVKVLHELGHAYCCKRFGGECHQIGLMLLVFMPCLYCDVSDAWLLPSRRKRMFISAAGIYVELILATLAAVLWYFSQPGLTSALLLNVMFVCGVSTFLVNGNPLLRYDGYYILADLVDLPNLSSRASETLWRPLRTWLYGQNPRREPPEPRWRFLMTYGLAALVYRTILLGVILWLTYRTLKQYDLRLLGDLVVVVALAGMLLGPAIRTYQRWSVPREGRSRMRGKRLAILLGFGAALVAALLLAPIPTRLHTVAISEAAQSDKLYAAIDGRLEYSLPAGTMVEANQVVMQLANADLEAKALELSGEIEEQLRQVETLRLRANNDPTAASQIPTAESALADLRQRYEVLQRDLDSLTIHAPQAGLLLAAPYRIDPHSSERTLSTWSGYLTEPTNLGCWVERGQRLCRIAEPGRLEARVIVMQDQVELVRIGDRVDLLFDSQATHAVSGVIDRIATDQTLELPRNLAHDSTLPLRQLPGGETQLAEGNYVAIVTLETPPPGLLPGSAAKCVILGRWQTLAEIGLRYLRLNFRFYG